PEVGGRIGAEVVSEIHQRAQAIGPGRAEGDDGVPDRQGSVRVVKAAAQRRAGWSRRRRKAATGAAHGAIGTKRQVNQRRRSGVEDSATGTGSTRNRTIQTEAGTGLSSFGRIEKECAIGRRQHTQVADRATSAHTSWIDEVGDGFAV